MAWNVIPTFLPQDNLTSTWLNTYLRGNLAECEAEKVTAVDSLVSTAGANAIRGSLIQRSAVTTTTFTTTSTTPVAITNPTLSISHSGYFILFFGAVMLSTAGELSQVGPQINGVTGAEAALSRTIRTQNAITITYGASYFYSNIPTSPVTAQLYGWTNTGSGTLQVAHRWMTAIAL